jgi:RNA polymerase sigma-70 factor (ECF subfamily)
MEADSLGSLPPDSAFMTHGPGSRGAAECQDEQRVQRAQAGEMAAFRELVSTHQRAVFSLALRLLGRREDAQELAQDVFVLLHRHLPRINSATHLYFWLRKTTCHRAIDRLRSRPRITALPLEAAADSEAPVPHSDPILERHVRQLIATLAPIPRAVLLLRYQEDLDPPDIAATLGLPLNTVKSHLRRSMALLRDRCSHLQAAHAGGVQT